MAQALWTTQQTHARALLILAEKGISPAGPNHYRAPSRSASGRSYRRGLRWHLEV